MFNYIYGFYYDMDCAKKKMDIDAIMSLPGKYAAADGFIAVIRGVIQGEDSEYEKFDDTRSKLCNSLCSISGIILTASCSSVIST